MSILKVGRPSLSQKEKAVSSIQELKEETIRMNVNIPKSFHKKIKQFALDKDITVTELVVKALADYIKESK